MRVALAGAAVAGIVVLYAETGNHASAAAPVPQELRSTVRLGWDERSIAGPPLRFRIESVAVGKRTWVVRASVRNTSTVPLGVEPGRNASTQDAGPSLVVSYVIPTDFRAQFRVVPATEFTPPLPASLEPGGSWHGTFAGLGKVPHRTLVHVGFGLFRPPGHDGAFGWVSQNSFRLG